MLADPIAHSSTSLDRATRLARRLPAPLLARQLTVEFVGTFILVLTIGLSTSSKGAGDLAPIAIGSALIQHAEADDGVQVLVFRGADPEYFISHVDVTRIAEYRIAGFPAGGHALVKDRVNAIALGRLS